MRFFPPRSDDYRRRLCVKTSAESHLPVRRHVAKSTPYPYTPPTRQKSQGITITHAPADISPKNETPTLPLSTRRFTPPRKSINRRAYSLHRSLSLFAAAHNAYPYLHLFIYLSIRPSREPIPLFIQPSPRAHTATSIPHLRYVYHRPSSGTVPIVYTSRVSSCCCCPRDLCY